MILLMILVAACRPQKPAPFMEGSIDKPGTIFSGRLDSVWRCSCQKDSRQSLLKLPCIDCLTFLMNSLLLISKTCDPSYEHGTSCLRGHYEDD